MGTEPKRFVRHQTTYSLRHKLSIAFSEIAGPDAQTIQQLPVLRDSIRPDMALCTANIVGSGPNGLAAAITLAQRGVAVTVYERSAGIGGAATTAELTFPGFRHDVGSSVYPLGIASPFFRTLPLAAHGLRFIQPPAPLAHPLDDGTALTLERDIDATIAQLTIPDGNAWCHLLGPLVADWETLVNSLMQPLLSIPRHPLGLARFGMEGGLPAATLAKLYFRDQRTRTLLAGCAAHSVLPLTRIGSSAAGLVLAAAAHTTGWPIAEGGAQSLSNALANYLRSLGGRIFLNADIEDLAQLDPADATLFDTGPRALDRIAGPALTTSFRTRMRHFNYGPGIFKVDWALSDPIPWTATACRRAGTIHLGGSLAEIAASESSAFTGKHCDRPYVLLVQPSLFDPTRAPAGRHTAWAYCHTPNGSTADLTEIVEAQVARFAPGFQDCILARHTRNSAQLEAWNPNNVGGDITGGEMNITQLITRPTAHLYRTSNPRLYLCSASTPPGGGVHGMCGHLAALAALSDHAS
jgi:phytoene dehydrogenase-like protein